MNIYADNKPKDCRLCSYWDRARKKCGLGECYFLKEAPKKEPSPCDGCPYGKGREFCFPCWKKMLGQGGVK